MIVPQTVVDVILARMLAENAQGYDAYVRYNELLAHYIKHGELPSHARQVTGI